VIDLSRLRPQQGRREAARQELVAIDGWFIEECNTADLPEARALLAELSREILHIGLWHEMTASRLLGMNDELPLGCRDPVTGPGKAISAADKAARCVTRGSAVATSTPLPRGLRLDAVSWEQTLLLVRRLIVQLIAVS
jgi:hypothetical protein